jgi:hypothetical protein
MANLNFKLMQLKKLIISLVIFLSLSDAFCQFEQMILPSDLKQQTVITEPSTLRKGFFRSSLNLSYSVIDKIFNDEGVRNYGSEMNGWGSSNSYQLSMMYGITDRLMIGTDIPYFNDRFYIASEIKLPGLDSTVIRHYNTDGVGLSDIDFTIDYQFIYRNEGKTSLKGQGTLTIPSGRKNPENIESKNEYDKPTGGGNTSLDLRLVYRQIVYPYSFSGYLSYKYNFKGSKIFYPDEDPVEFSGGNMFYVGGSFNVHLNEWIALMNELAFSTWSDYPYDGETAADTEQGGRYIINYQPALVFQVRRFRFFEVIRLPLKGKNTGADPAYVFGLQYTF